MSHRLHRTIDVDSILTLSGLPFSLFGCEITNINSCELRVNEYVLADVICPISARLYNYDNAWFLQSLTNRSLKPLRHYHVGL